MFSLSGPAWPLQEGLLAHPGQLKAPSSHREVGVTDTQVQGRGAGDGITKKLFGTSII